MNEAVFAIFGITLIAFILWHVFALVLQMAQERGHNPWGWLFISLCWSPFGSIIAMWLFFPIDELSD